jgi:endonuclease-3 related protein
VIVAGMAERPRSASEMASTDPMPTLDESFETLQLALVATFGHARPEFEGLPPFETMIAVLLARTLGESAWRTALDGLREAELLTPEGLAGAEVIEISDAVRKKGSSVAAETLAPIRHLARWLVEHHDGRVELLFNPDRSSGWLFGELSAIKGVGVKGANAILLHALKRPFYPVDRATYRILVRHGWLDPSAVYEEARDLLIGQIAPDLAYRVDQAESLDDRKVSELADLAHGMEQVGRRFCRATATDCAECPLEDLLPEGGPRGAED